MPAQGDFPTIRGCAGRLEVPAEARRGERETGSEQAFGYCKRRGRDSNPRWTNQAHNGFRDRHMIVSMTVALASLPRGKGFANGRFRGIDKLGREAF